MLNKKCSKLKKKLKKNFLHFLKNFLLHQILILKFFQLDHEFLLIIIKIRLKNILMQNGSIFQITKRKPNYSECKKKNMIDKNKIQTQPFFWVLLPGKIQCDLNFPPAFEFIQI